MTMTPGSAEPAAELEAADREFSGQTQATGYEAWASYLADDGAEWGGSRRVERAELVAWMRRVLAQRVLTWEPIASRRRGDYAFTVGRYRLVSRLDDSDAETGTYVSIWRRQADGKWKIAFDIGSHLAR